MSYFNVTRPMGTVPIVQQTRLDYRGNAHKKEIHGKKREKSLGYLTIKTSIADAVCTNHS